MFPQRPSQFKALTHVSASSTSLDPPGHAVVVSIVPALYAMCMNREQSSGGGADGGVLGGNGGELGGSIGGALGGLGVFKGTRHEREKPSSWSL